MTKREQQEYKGCEELKQIIDQLKGCKFELDCGHHVTFGHFLGNDVTIRNGSVLTITCSQCGY